MKLRNFAAAVSVLGQLIGLYAWRARPSMLRWGATPEEQLRRLPGDELVPSPTAVTTHGVTIHAPAQDIWPWLVQMGQDRAGFYTHNWVERLLRSGIPDVHQIHSQWQKLKPGDLVRTNRELRAGHPMGWPVEIVEPNRALVLRSTALPKGTYAYVLQPIDGHTTRLLSRDRALWRWWEAPFRFLLFEPLHAYMQTGVLIGTKQRAEQYTSHAARTQ